MTFLRAAYFMENLGASLYALGTGRAPHLPPRIARHPHGWPRRSTSGRPAAKLLVEGGHGKRVVQLAGPREYSPKDIAGILSRIVGRTIAVRQEPEEAMVPALTGAGLNGEWARLFQEMTHGVNTGHVDWEKGPANIKGNTEPEAVLRKLLRK